MKKTIWEDKVTLVDAEKLNNIEDNIELTNNDLQNFKKEAANKNHTHVTKDIQFSSDELFCTSEEKNNWNNCLELKENFNKKKAIGNGGSNSFPVHLSNPVAGLLALNVIRGKTMYKYTNNVLSNDYIHNNLRNSNSKINWTSISSNFSFKDNCFTFTSNSFNGGISSNDIEYENLKGHKVYFTSKIKSDHEIVNFYVATEQTTYMAKYKDVNSYEKCSLIQNLSPDLKSLTIKFLNGQSDNFTPVFVKDIMIIDLTDMFGEGNEPTLQWCDENIPFVTEVECLESCGEYEKKIELSTVCKNLFNINDTFEKGEDTNYRIEENKLIVTGKTYISKTIKLKKQTSYFFSFYCDRYNSTTAKQCLIKDSITDKVIIECNGGVFNTGNSEYITIYIYANNNGCDLGDVSYSNIQLEEGREKTSCDRFREDKMMIVANDNVPLRSLDNVTYDEINNNAIIRRIDAFHLDKNCIIKNISSSQNFIDFSFQIMNGKEKGLIMCDKFKTVKDKNGIGEWIYSDTSLNNDENMLVTIRIRKNKLLNYGLKNDDNKTYENSFKKWLENNNTSIFYELKKCKISNDFISTLPVIVYENYCSVFFNNRVQPLAAEFKYPKNTFGVINLINRSIDSIVSSVSNIEENYINNIKTDIDANYLISQNVYTCSNCDNLPENNSKSTLIVLNPMNSNVLIQQICVMSISGNIYTRKFLDYGWTKWCKFLLEGDEKKQTIILENITIQKTGWIANSGMYTYKYDNDKIESKSSIDVNFQMNSIEKANVLKSFTQSFKGYFYLYSNSIPDADLICDIIIHNA